MNIPQYQLKSTSRGNWPRRIIIFDTESNTRKVIAGEKQSFRIAWTAYIYYTGDGDYSEPVYTFFDDREKLCEYIESKTYEKSETWLIAHNIFYDLTVSGFFVYFDKRKWKRTFWYDSQLTYILGMQNGTKKIICISSTNYFSLKLSDLGEIIGRKKIEIDVFKAPLKKLITYCRRDVEILVLSITDYAKFIFDHGGNGLFYTRASQSLAFYRSRFMNIPINIVQDDSIKEFEKQCYFGGRTEAFFIGKHPGNDFVSYDINSMYPFVMREYKYPTGTVGKYEKPRIDWIIERLDEYGACAKIELMTDQPIYPKRHNHKLLFPVGNFTTYLNTPEIKEAYERGHIKNIEYATLYNMDYIFRNYIDYWYPLKAKYKKEKNDLYVNIVKIFLNSLYGKFGQGFVETETIDINIPEKYFRLEIFDDVTGERKTVTIFLNTCTIETDAKIGKKSYVAIASHVTAYARLLLWKIIEQIGYGNVLYCDTDSVKIERKYETNITHPISKYGIGDLSIDDEMKSLIIYGAKDYKTDKHAIIKGVPSTANEIEPGKWIYKQFCGQSTHLRLGLADEYFVRDIEKKRKTNYTKAKVNPDGYCSPLVFDNDELVKD